MALPATEAFTYANNSQLDAVNANWTKNTTVNGQIHIQTNQGFTSSVGGTAPSAYYHWNADTFNDDQYSKVVINAAGNSGNHLYLGVNVRATTGATSKKRYFWQGSGADRYLAKNDGTTETALGEDSSAQVAGDTWEIDASGTTITAKINGSVIFTVTDGTITSGSAGLDCYSDNVETETDALMDNWEGGNLTGPVTIAVPAGAMKFADQTPWALVQDTYVPHLIIQNRLAP